MTNQKTVTLVVSDLHVGGGTADPGDDHVHHREQFRNFILANLDTPEGRAGDVELIVNGDFLEFAQVSPDVYRLGSSKYWCSEQESRSKLDDMINGHSEIFDAMKTFQRAGNRVTVAAGNHDVDLFWPDVQRRLREAAGDALAFETGTNWYARYGGRLLVGHGHMFDPANKFANWQDPVLRDTDPPRLEMCAGTLFMVKFVNWLEKDYPFSDNLKPVTALYKVLLKENRLGLLLVGWMFAKFIARYPRLTANVKELNREIGRALLQKIELDDEFAARLTELYREVSDPDAQVADVRRALATEEAVFAFLLDMMPRLDPERWLPVFGEFRAGTLGTGGGGGRRRTLAIKEANNVDKDFLWDKAQQELLKEGGPEVVIMGHTHQPDERRAANGRPYFNPGSWTRYVDYDANPSLSLSDLMNETSFPYELNYVRLEEDAEKSLRAEMICYERGD